MLEEIREGNLSADYQIDCDQLTKAGRNIQSLIRTLLVSFGASQFWERDSIE